MIGMLSIQYEECLTDVDDYKNFEKLMQINEDEDISKVNGDCGVKQGKENKGLLDKNDKNDKRNDNILN